MEDFTNVIDFFSLDQLANTPIHKRSHTLDLVLTHGLAILGLHVDDVHCF